MPGTVNAIESAVKGAVAELWRPKTAIHRRIGKMPGQRLLKKNGGCREPAAAQRRLSVGGEARVQRVVNEFAAQHLRTAQHALERKPALLGNVARGRVFHAGANHQPVDTVRKRVVGHQPHRARSQPCLLYTSDAADE